MEFDDGQGTTIVNIGTVMLKRPAPVLDDTSMQSVEHELAHFLGPLAKMIVKKAAAVSRDRAELCSLLSENFPDPDTRRRFVDAFNRTVSGSRGPATGSNGARGAKRATCTLHTPPADNRTKSNVVAALDDDYIEQVTRSLAVRIGPIARLVARKAARQARSRGEFVRLVAKDLDADVRTAFLGDGGATDF